MTIIEKINI